MGATTLSGRSGGIGSWGPTELLAIHQTSMLQLTERFTKLEQHALTMPTSPLGAYQCFRLDGIKVSKNYLSDKLTYPAFRDALDRSVAGVYHLFRRYLGEEYGERDEGNFFVGIIVVSDEVSFILNNRRDFFGNRLMKTATSLASSLSAAMSLNFRDESARLAKPNAHGHKWPQVIAFDGRPLVLDTTQQIEDYLRYRWLLSARNAMCKVLRVGKIIGDDAMYATALKNNLPELAGLVERHGLRDSCAAIMSEFTLFVPELPNELAKLVEISTPPGFNKDVLEAHCASLRKHAEGPSL